MLLEEAAKEEDVETAVLNRAFTNRDKVSLDAEIVNFYT